MVWTLHLHDPNEEVLAELRLGPREPLLRGQSAEVDLEYPRPVRRRQRLRVHFGEEHPEFHVACLGVKVFGTTGGFAGVAMRLKKCRKIENEKSMIRHPILFKIAF